jgi:hypothetical protein
VHNARGPPNAADLAALKPAALPCRHRCTVAGA